MLLKVMPALRDEVFTDMVRVPKRYRGGAENGEVVRIEYGGKHVFAIARGLGDREDKVILADEFIRRRLGIEDGSAAEIDSDGIRVARLHERVLWYLRATNPAVHVPAWLAVISIAVSAASILSIYVSAWLSTVVVVLSVAAIAKWA